jgi:signal peptidase II
MNRKILLVAATTLFLDQLSKVLIDTFLLLNEEIVIFQNFFSLHYMNNYGVAWSLLDNKISLIIVISLFALILIYHFMYQFVPNKRNNLAFGLLVGGIVGNLMDRWLFGYVRDFLDFKILGYDYPIFNIADIGVVIGTILLIIAVCKGEDHRENMDC